MEAIVSIITLKLIEMKVVYVVGAWKNLSAYLNLVNSPLVPFSSLHFRVSWKFPFSCGKENAFVKKESEFMSVTVPECM
jgi:hypothetical protein